MHLIKAFVPERVTENSKREFTYSYSTVFCADISGFTNMSEKLSAMGKEGSEEITNVINLFFEPLVEIILKRGGDIFFFGGDAITAIFDKGREADSLIAAIEASDYVKKHSVVRTSGGSFLIGMHIALNYGKVYFQDTGRSYILGGENCFKVIELLDFASKGEIVASDSMKKKLLGAVWEKSSDSVYKFVKLKDSNIIKKTAKRESKKQSKKDITPYVPLWIRRQTEIKSGLNKNSGEHRRAAMMFVHFRNIDFDKNRKKTAKLIESLTESLRKSGDKYKGWINKIDFYKDGIRALVVFGYPEKLDNDEKHAVLFADEIMSNEDLKEISISIGINSGFIFKTPVGSINRMEITVMGDAVNTTARIAAKAGDRMILTGESVFEKTKDSISYRKRAAKAMKGKTEKVKIFEFAGKKIKSDKNSVNEWLSESKKLIGNKDVIKSFGESVERAKRGSSSVFTIEGHAGLGKSRLVRELEKTLKDNGFRVFQGDCLSYGSALSYHPWIESLNAIFEISLKDSMDSKKRKISEFIKQMDPTLKKWLPLLGELMSLDFPMTDLVKNLDTSVKMQKFFDIVLDILLFLSKKTPVAIIIEDYHWADNSSSELLNYICQNTKNERILFLITFRPINEQATIKPPKADVSCILKELSESETNELIESLLCVKNLDREMKKLVMKKSQGNPFYVEELVKSLIEQDYIVRGKSGWEISKKAKDIVLPDSVEEVILARIDRLDLQERELLQTASVLGREFSRELLEALYKEKKFIDSSMNVLKNLDLIKTDEENFERFIFKHILTCETAYNTLSFARRRQVHESVGRILEKSKKNKQENLAMLSHHYHYAHNYKKSVDYSLKAGRKAKVVYANEEGLEFFSRAIEDCVAGGDLFDMSAAEAHEERASVLSFVGRGAEAILDTTESFRYAEKSGDKRLMAMCLSEACIVYELSSNFDKMKDAAEKALEIYSETQDNFGMAKAYNYIGMYYGITGEPKREMEILFKAVYILKGLTGGDKRKENSEYVSLLGVILNNLGYVQRLLGDNKSALENYEKSLDARRSIEDKTGVAQVLNNIGMIHGRAGDIPKALPYFEESIKIYEEIGNKKGLGSSLVNYGVFNGRIGNEKMELECYERGLKIQKQINDRYVMSFTLTNIGNYHSKKKDWKRALKCHLEAIAIRESINERASLPSSYSYAAKCYEMLNQKNKQIEYEFKASEETRKQI